jgi:hypothetical protein
MTDALDPNLRALTDVIVELTVREILEFERESGAEVRAAGCEPAVREVEEKCVEEVRRHEHDSSIGASAPSTRT